jgi:signal transduction histidine kinase
MQERVHLVNGTFIVESKVDRGTRVSARVPFHVVNGLPEASEAQDLRSPK